MVQAQKEGNSDWYCEISSANNNINLQSIYQLEGLPDEFVTSHYNALISGESRIHIDEVIKAPNHAIITIKPGTHFQLFYSTLSLDQIRSINQKTIGEKSLAIVKVKFNFEFSPLTLSDDEIIESVFGTTVGSMNYQFKACSYNKLSFKPAKGVGINDKGIIQLNLNINPIGKKMIDILNCCVEKVSEKIGNLQQFDHVVFFLPFGSFEEKFYNLVWGAFAVVNGRISIFNSLNGRYLSALMHEISHNLGLTHSAEHDNEYGDNTGYMGETYTKNDTPLMCFNAVHSWKLGWYEDQHVSLTPETQGISWIGKLYGVDDYQTVTQSSAVILKIESKIQNKKLYVMYNSKKGINKETTEYANKLMVVEELNDNFSTIRGVLARYEEFRQSNFNGNHDLVVKNCIKNGVFTNTIVFIDSSPNNMWYDARGMLYTCEWYASGQNRCATHGKSHRNFGMVASEICCYCLENFGIFRPVTTSK